MEKHKTYKNVRFPPYIIENAYKQLLTLSSEARFHTFEVVKGGETWLFDSMEEFLSAYTGFDSFRFSCETTCRNKIFIFGDENYLCIQIAAKNREEIESIFSIFEQAMSDSVVKKSVRVFIGHGRDMQWRDLKDHLQDKHSIHVEAFEISPRAGLSFKEVLSSMLDKSTMALLVLTGEDIDAEGSEHARENVIHELGLFQGRLGFEKAIVVLEKDVNQFSNILGITQIRFSKGSISESFGEIVATIRREHQ